ncbi:NAD(P)/FAD-dependent oxidoreductase [Acidiphilium sp. AL]|uniref:NAD(P)/FAD-dependent oxidoreductase n=1 Tax=Acidiphilium iwatense TaxID=768198 RepID=A0ABS9DRA8_9PROT|nr:MULTISPECIES: NAD(P)/FAD-dependent oxidoreductase [Acidiphilium]MCF3945257.1 NAD(P)/FAD-dependent oxidoreductase [Acidiphilium iwatense]MCU4159448.1 NAD(P)/FAD-dependent oxidoreductase [Acidiphilium sp. AL]
MRQFDVVVLGAGAAGLMCAIVAGRRGRRVLVLDHADEPGRKILISGGGRCNFTNIHTAPERFFSANPHFCKSALSRYTPRDFLDLVEKHGIAWHEKTLGQLFCDGSARAIVAMLLAECEAAGVKIQLGCRIAEVTRTERFRVETDTGAIAAESVVLATGGLSIPKLGATGLAHDIAVRFGLRLIGIRPGLVPLSFAAADLARTQKLAGVSLPVDVRCGAKKFREAMLFTHRGISGPAILQISSVWRDGVPIMLDLLPDEAAGFLQARKRARPGVSARTVLAEVLPQRMADVFLPDELSAGRIGAQPDRALMALGSALKSWQVTPAGSEGYAKAEVTLGGVDTACLSSRTMEARSAKGLFVIGEAVDVTGWLGGYNFQWAWASGWCAGCVA